MLEAAGAEVTISENGLVAVDYYTKQDFDLIAMDVSMPVMGGIQATLEIRKLEAELARKRSPIIGLTAHASDSEREKSFASGMNDQLVKPVMPEELVAAILRCKAVSLSTASAEK